MSTKHTNWKITNNTDGVDIQDKCIGLSPYRPSIPKDVADHIHRDRGLHIQIRHNKDPQAFAQANDLARLISAAPELLDVLKTIYKLYGDKLDKKTWDKMIEAITKAQGGDS